MDADSHQRPADRGLHFELPMTLGETTLDHTPRRAVTTPPGAKVVTVAERGLEAGEHLNGTGGFCCHDLADKPISLDAVELDEGVLIVALRREQDGAALAQGGGAP